jgi:hypothetical protein
MTGIAAINHHYTMTVGKVALGGLARGFFFGIRYRYRASGSKKVDYDNEHPPSPFCFA